MGRLYPIQLLIGYTVPGCCCCCYSTCLATFCGSCELTAQSQIEVAGTKRLSRVVVAVAPPPCYCCSACCCCCVPCCCCCCVPCCCCCCCKGAVRCGQATTRCQVAKLTICCQRASAATMQMEKASKKGGGPIEGGSAGLETEAVAVACSQEQQQWQQQCQWQWQWHLLLHKVNARNDKTVKVSTRRWRFHSVSLVCFCHAPTVAPDSYLSLSLLSLTLSTSGKRRLNGIFSCIYAKSFC